MIIITAKWEDNGCNSGNHNHTHNVKQCALITEYKGGIPKMKAPLAIMIIV